MQPKPRGRPCAPLDPNASKTARLGCDVQALRRARGLSQVALGELIGCSGQHVSDIERARACVALSCIAAIDDALGAQGALVALQPAVSAEREAARQERAAARRGESLALSALRCALHREVGDDDVEPTTRLGLLEAGASVALGVPMLGGVPARAGEVDPGLVDHWTNLLNLLGRHNQAFGSRAVRDAVRRELRLITEHRAAARGELRVALMRVEACWCEFGAWLAHDCGDRRERDALLNRAMHLAREAAYADMLAWARARFAQWSDALPLALRHAEAGLRTPGAGAHARAMCATRVAHAHACIGDAESTERSIAEAERLVGEESAPLPPPDQGMTYLLVRRWEARCWAALKPIRAIDLYDGILRDQPRAWVGGHGLYLAYLANACADAGELDRAKAEGAKALAIYKQTRSASAARELGRLRTALAAA